MLGFKPVNPLHSLTREDQNEFCLNSSISALHSHYIPSQLLKLSKLLKLKWLQWETKMIHLLMNVEVSDH